MTLDELISQVLLAIVPVALAAITYASAALARYLRARTDSEYWTGVVNRLDRATHDVVAELEQTVVSGLRKASEDGRITPEEARRIREEATGKILEYLGPKGVATAERIMDRDALEAIVRAKIEAAVHDMRRWDPPNG
jgi:hypothetical protein